MLAAVSAFAQAADQTGPFRPEEEKPRTFHENLEKLRIQRAKKDHDQMITRGAEAVKLSKDLERTVVSRGSLTEGDLDKVAQVEKLVKKIREELGGNGDGDVDDPVVDGSDPIPATDQGMVHALKARAESMYEQIKNTTRFTISASAIIATNAVLKVARFLKFSH
jgi:hypothetical protein